jgi:hypothetical protein
MIRTLAIIAASGMVLSLMCFAGAGALGWRPEESWFRHFAHWDGFDSDRDDDDGFGGPQITREIPWSGGDRLTFTLPGRVHFTQGPEISVKVTGPQRKVEAMKIDDDGELKARHRRWSGDQFEIEITAPAVRRFKINGSADLEIENFAQDKLDVEVNGSGDVIARGAARRAEITINGSGNADLSGVTGEEARVEIMGSGEAKIAPSALAEVRIMGSGDVDLVSDTARVESKIYGSGRVNRVDPIDAPPSETVQSTTPRKTPARKAEEAAPSVAP